MLIFLSYHTLISLHEISIQLATLCTLIGSVVPHHHNLEGRLCHMSLQICVMSVNDDHPFLTNGTCHESKGPNFLEIGMCPY